MGDEREPKRLPDTPPTLPRGLHGGTNGEVSWLRDSTRLPGFPVAFLSGEPGLKGQVPVTVAGPRRICTGFRKSPFVWSSIVQQRLVYWLCAPDARAVSSSAFSLPRSVWYESQASADVFSSRPR